MPKGRSAEFKEIINYDDYKYVVTSEIFEPVDEDFPNLPDHSRWGLPDSLNTSFVYKGLDYRLLSNIGDADCNDGIFGALLDANNEKVVDLLSTGDTETTIASLKNDDVKMDVELRRKLKPYLDFFTIILANETEFEYLVFKILVESKRLYDIKEIDHSYDYRDEESSEDEEEEEEEEEDGEEE